MINLDSWSRRRVRGGVVLSSRSGPLGGIVRIHVEKSARPIRDYLPDGDGAVRLRRLATNAGELAVIAGRCTDTLMLAGAIAGRSFMVFKGFCSDEGSFESFSDTFEELLRCSITGDDPLRRRMYVYRPPPGWHGVRRAFSSCWFAPCYPSDSTFFEVFDALPIGDGAALFTHELLVGAVDDREIVRRTDARFVYELHHAWGKGGQSSAGAFEQLVASVENLPEPQRILGAEEGLLWVS